MFILSSFKKACTHYVAKMSLFPINSTESAKWHLSHRSVRQLYLQVDEILRMKSEYDLIGVMDTKSTHTQVYCFKWKLVKHAVFVFIITYLGRMHHTMEALFFLSHNSDSFPLRYKVTIARYKLSIQRVTIARKKSPNYLLHFLFHGGNQLPY